MVIFYTNVSLQKEVSNSETTSVKTLNSDMKRTTSVKTLNSDMKD